MGSQEEEKKKKKKGGRDTKKGRDEVERAKQLLSLACWRESRKHRRRRRASLCKGPPGSLQGALDPADYGARVQMASIGHLLSREGIGARAQAAMPRGNAASISCKKNRRRLRQKERAARRREREREKNECPLAPPAFRLVQNSRSPVSYRLSPPNGNEKLTRR